MVKKYFKNFFGYIDDDNIKPFYIILPKMSGCAKCFDETKYMSCRYMLIYVMLKACNNAWGKISNIINSDIDNETVYNEKY